MNNTTVQVYIIHNIVIENILMSRFVLSADLHLGHDNILKYRSGFDSPEEHHNILFDNLASFVQPRDTLILLGDIATTPFWLERVASIQCTKKVLVLDNHCTNMKVNGKMLALADGFDEIHSMLSKRNTWFTHCPIHPQELHGKLNVHGHLHDSIVLDDAGKPDPRYINVSVDQTQFRPVLFGDVVSQITR